MMIVIPAKRSRQADQYPRKWFYCGDIDRNNRIKLKQRVERVTGEMCDARCASGTCPKRYKEPRKCGRYRQEVLND